MSFFLSLLRPSNMSSSYPQYLQEGAMPPAYAAPGQIYGAPTMVPQYQTAVVMPIYRRYWNNSVSTPITPDVRKFLVFSGILYLIWGILAVGLEIGIIVNSYVPYYRGFWMGFFVIISGIMMLVAACQANYALQSLVRLFTAALIFCILGVVVSSVNYASSTRCNNRPWTHDYSCDTKIASDLKIVILIVSTIATVDTIINIVFIRKTHTRSLL